MSKHLGLELVSSIINSGSMKDYLGLGISEDMLRASEKAPYTLLRDHIFKYGKIPSPITFDELTKGMHLPDAPEPPAFYADQIRVRALHDSIAIAVNDMQPLLAKNGAEYNPKQAMDNLTNLVVHGYAQQNQNKIFDFREAKGMILQAYKQAFTGEDTGGIPLGWPYLDGSFGHIMPGDVVSFVGRPAMGKSWFLLYAMYQAWWLSKKRVIFVSMEMSPLAVMQRLTALHAKVNPTKLKKAEMTTKGMNKMVNALVLAEQHSEPMLVVDGNLTATVEDIWRMCLQFKPDAIYIDGAYLLKHPNKKINKYERVAENAELIKSEISTNLGVPPVCSYQFSRDAAKKLKKKNGEAIGLEDIGYSDVIGQVSSLVLGLLEDESVETIQRRKITVMKGRDGHTGEFLVNWDFQGMDFRQYFEPDINGLTFM